MNAILTLDHDVATLLEQARRERGGSLDSLANTLLRRTLEEAYMGVAGFRRASPGEPEPVAANKERSTDAASLEARIDQLYDEIRELIAQSAEKPSLKGEVECKREQLYELQAEEAATWKQRAEARRHLKPGEGYRLLERAASLLDS